MQLDSEPFLQRIRAFPDDDVPRLIYADWLDDEYPEAADRAAFIRIQIALAGLPDDDSRRSALGQAERELLEKHREEWENPFRGLATGLQFRRGFVDEVKIAARQYLRHANELFSAGPIRHIHLLDIGGSLHSVMQCPYLSRLSALTVFAQHAGEPLARSVARSANLQGLRMLHLGRNRLGDAAAEHLASGTVLGNLVELDLSENEIGETGARSLGASPHLAKLENLELRYNALGPAGAEALAGSERLTSLFRLGLAGNDIGVPRLYSLARISSLLRVPSLDLTGNGLTAPALKTILTRPAGDESQIRLRNLDLSHNELGEAGMRVLANSESLANLKILRLAGCSVTDEGLRILAQSVHLNRLIALELGNNPVNDPGFRALHDSPHFRSLRRLVVPIGVTLPMRRALDQRFHKGVVRF